MNITCTKLLPKSDAEYTIVFFLTTKELISLSLVGCILYSYWDEEPNMYSGSFSNPKNGNIIEKGRKFHASYIGSGKRIASNLFVIYPDK